MMKRCKNAFFITALFFLIASILVSCAQGPAPNKISTPSTPAIPDNLVGKSGGFEGGNRISATYEMVDYSYITIDGSSQKIRSGAGTKYPAIGTIKPGQKIRALGKLDGWYIVSDPNTGRIGSIPSTNAKPYSDGKGTAAPSPEQNSGTGETTKNSPPSGPSAVWSGVADPDESKILKLVNAERSKAGARALAPSKDCAKLARMKSQDMVKNNYFSHQSPTYGSPFDMLKANKVSYMYAGENIAMNQTAEAAFRSWMNSEGHRKNILNPNFTELGIGIAPKGDGSLIYTQLFIGR